MQNKTNMWLLLGVVILFVLAVLFTHQPKYMEDEQAVLVDFAALVPADGVVELNRDAPPPGKQFIGEDAIAVVLAVQEAGLIPYSGPKHTPAPGYAWSISCMDGAGNDLFILYVGTSEVQYYSFSDETNMYYSLSQEDMDALHVKLEQFFNT